MVYLGSHADEFHAEAKTEYRRPLWQGNDFLKNLCFKKRIAKEGLLEVGLVQSTPYPSIFFIKPLNLSTAPFSRP